MIMGYMMGAVETVGCTDNCERKIPRCCFVLFSNCVLYCLSFG